MQRCVWERPKKVSGIYQGQTLSEDEIIELPRIRISKECIKKIKSLTNTRLPVLRQSVQEVIEPLSLEESILSTVVKHFSLKEIIDNLSYHEQEMTKDYFELVDIMSETYKKINGLIRILQQIAELETKWENDLQDYRENSIKLNDVFFNDFCHDESKMRNLALLSFMFDIDFNQQMPQKSVDTLKTKMELESLQEMKPKLSVTMNIMKAITQRIDLLLKVSIPGSNVLTRNENMSRSLQNWPSVGTKKWKNQFSVDQSFDDSILQIPKLQMKIQVRRMNTSPKHDQFSGDEESKKLETCLLDQLFNFIGSHPEKAVSSNDFIEAARARKMRGICRKQSLTVMSDLLQISESNGSLPYVMDALSKILKDGPKLSELTCGGMKDLVLQMFSEVLTNLVGKSEENILLNKSCIGLLCTIPFTQNEEICIVKSGLISLLDRMCGMNNIQSSDDKTNCTFQNLSYLAWAGFKVLANRCMKWQEGNIEVIRDDFQHIRLPQQVSVLITNNLNRTKNDGFDNTDYEGLQEILTLLNLLAESKMGKDILSQPTCISKLLSLLLEPNLSPKMIQTIIQLCHVALPLIKKEVLSNIDVPVWSVADETITTNEDDPSIKMIKLLLAKISDYIVPGFQVSAVIQRKLATDDFDEDKTNAVESLEENTVIPDDIPDMDRNMSLYLYKNPDEPAHDVIQQLLNVSSELRLFRMTESQNMEKIVKMDKDLNKSNKTEVTTDDATIILRRAIKLAQQGFIVSVGPPQRIEEFTEEKKSAVDHIAKERNNNLMKNDPLRPFISSSVANSLAAELIALIHTLLNSNADNFWVDAINTIVTSKLKYLRKVSESKQLIHLENCNEISSLFFNARDVIAVLATLGGLAESLKPGQEVEIIGGDIDDCRAEILSISESSGQATVKLIIPENLSHYPRPSDILLVPLDRIKVKRSINPVSIFTPVVSEIIDALQSVLLPDPSGSDPLSAPLPSIGEGRSLKLATARLVAEIRSMATSLLSIYLKDSEFACRFLQNSCQAVDMLKLFSKDCLPSDRKQTIMNSTEKLRNLYRDCIKPPAPPSRKLNSKQKIMIWDPSKVFPPLKSVLFSHNMLGITYYDDPGNNTGHPRGILVYSNQMIPQNTNNFYWELDVISLGDSPDDSGSPIISVGFAPLAEKSEGTWCNPVGTMFFHNNGRVVHYNGQSLLQWRSLRFDVQLNPGDTLGIGWEKLFEASSTNPASGRVYFTLNGNKLDQALEYVNGNMYPVVHIQKKNVRVKANFGSNKFVYAEGRMLQSRSLDLSTDSKSPRDEDLRNMPFQGNSSSDSSGSSSPENYDVGAGHRRYISYSSRTAVCPKSIKEYSPNTTEDFRSEPCHEPIAQTGSHIQPITLLDDDSESEDESDDEEGNIQNDDINSLLVKSWETKVFPIIRRRFRNETERRDGLEQIKGALSLGMADIARQTVEFLYEENGGIPRDLHLPTLEDIKEELCKFSIDRIKKGQSVIISCSTGMDITSLPKYFVPVMLKTIGLTGEVLEIDVPNELVQVESYLKLEGILVRFWYPLRDLEKPHDSSKKTAVTGTQVVNINNNAVHRELLSWEFASSRINCREAYITLLEQSKNPDLPTYICVDESSSMATMIKSSIMLFQDIDIENLLYLSNSLLGTAPNGNMVERNLNITSSSNIHENSKGRPSKLFYHDCEMLHDEISEYITKAGMKGEEFLIELSNQICSVMQHAPELFTLEEIVINDISSLKSCIHFPRAAFVAASVKINRSIKEAQDMKDLSIQIQTVDGTFVKQNGHMSSRDIVQYPLDVSGYKEPLHCAFPPVVMAADFVRVSHSGGEDMGFKLFLHSIPPELPLAISFMEGILEFTNAEENSLVSTLTMKHLIGILGSFLNHMDINQTFKEKLLLLLSEMIRVSCSMESRLLLPSIFTKFQDEMKLLYDVETSRKNFTRFSSYFQSLFEVSASLTDQEDEAHAFKLSRSPTPTIASDKESSPGFVPSLFKRRMRIASRRSVSPVSSKPNLTHSKDTNWYNKAISTNNLLKYMVDRKKKHFEKSLNIFKQVYQNQLCPNDHSRLIILSGLPRHFSEEQLREKLHVVLNAYGGLYKNDIFILSVDQAESMKKTEIDNEDQIVVENIEFDVEEEDLDNSVDIERSESLVEPVKPNCSGVAVVQLRSRVNARKCIDELEANDILSVRGEFDTDGSIMKTGGVLPTYKADDPFMDSILNTYLSSKLFIDKDNLQQDCYNALEDIFLSCYMANQKDNPLENIDLEDTIALQFSQILKQVEENMMYTFLYGIKQSRGGLLEGVREILQQYGKKCKGQPEFVPSTPARKKRNSTENQKPTKDVIELSATTVSKRDIIMNHY